MAKLERRKGLSLGFFVASIGCAIAWPVNKLVLGANIGAEMPLGFSLAFLLVSKGIDYLRLRAMQNICNERGEELGDALGMNEKLQKVNEGLVVELRELRYEKMLRDEEGGPAGPGNKLN